MFEIPEMTAEEQMKIKNTKVVPPFQTDNNQIEENLKSAKKMSTEKYIETRKPWTYGSLPGDPPNIKV